MHENTLYYDMSETPVTTAALPRAPPWCVLGINSRRRIIKCHIGLP